MDQAQLIIAVGTLAEGDFDFGFLIYVGILVAGAIGGLLKKKKTEREARGSPQSAPRRPPIRPVPQRPRESARREQVGPAPVARRQQPRSIDPRRSSPGPVVARAPRLLTREEVLRAQQGRPAPPPMPAPEPEPETLRVELDEPSAPVRPAPRSIESRRTESELSAQLLRLTRDRSQLQTALVLSEILAPPLALRQKDGGVGQ